MYHLMIYLFRNNLHTNACIKMTSTIIHTCGQSEPLAFITFVHMCSNNKFVILINKGLLQYRRNHIPSVKLHNHYCASQVFILHFACLSTSCIPWCLLIVLRNVYTYISFMCSCFSELVFTGSSLSQLV